MKTFFTLSCLLLLPFFAFCQNVNFSISGRSGYILPSKHTSSHENTSFNQLNYLNDSMGILSELNSNYDVSFSYKSKITYELEANINFPIYRKASIQTGIGLNWLSFKRTYDITNYQSTVLQEGDTISYDWTNNNGNLLICDRYVNEEVFDEREDGERYSVLHLTIPISIKYPIGNTKFAVKAGVYLQTPIFSQVSRDYIRRETEQTPTEVICTYILETTKDRTGQRVGDLQLGCHAELEYKLLEKLSASIRFSNNISSLLNNDSSTIQTISGDKFLPMRISGGLSLYLGKGNQEKVKPALY